MNKELKIADYPDPYEKLRDIAPRLGVEPLNESDTDQGMLILLKDGTRYDFWELVEAVLDKIDGVSKNKRN